MCVSFKLPGPRLTRERSIFDANRYPKIRKKKKHWWSQKKTRPSTFTNLPYFWSRWIISLVIIGTMTEYCRCFSFSDLITRDIINRSCQCCFPWFVLAFCQYRKIGQYCPLKKLTYQAICEFVRKYNWSV